MGRESVVSPIDALYVICLVMERLLARSECKMQGSPQPIPKRIEVHSIRGSGEREQKQRNFRKTL